jgi:chromosomal replication initiation ATPase DnaA
VLTSDFIKAAAEMFCVHPRDLASHYKFDFLMKPRFALYKALRLRGWSYPQIGRVLGRDHSTIIYGTKRAEYYAERDAEYAAKIKALAEMTYELEDVAEAA